MGVSMEQWHARVGTFSRPAASARWRAPAILIPLHNVAVFTLLITLLLVRAGDIESNPGPGQGPGIGRGARDRQEIFSLSQPCRDTNRGMTQSMLSFGQDDSTSRRTTLRSARSVSDSRDTAHLHDVGDSRGPNDRLSTDERLDMIFQRLGLLPILDERIGRMEQNLDASLQEMHRRLESYDARCVDLEAQNYELSDKLSRLEDQSRRDNLIFWGLPEKVGNTVETWNDCEGTIRTTLNETFGVEGAEDDSTIAIERAHRLNGTGKRGNPRAIIVKFGRYKHKQTVLDKVKSVIREMKEKDPAAECEVRVSDDYSAGVRETRKKLIPHLISFRKKYPEKKVYLRYDKLVVDRRVYVPDRDGGIRDVRGDQGDGKNSSDR